MSNEHKNFEDRLRNRLLQEELPYDDGAWEGFEQMSGELGASQSDDEQDGKRNRFAFWRWMRFGILLILLLSVGYWSLEGDDEMNFSSTNKNIEKAVENDNQTQIGKNEELMSQSAINQDESSKEAKISLEEMPETDLLTNETKGGLPLNEKAVENDHFGKGLSSAEAVQRTEVDFTLSPTKSASIDLNFNGKRSNNSKGVNPEVIDEPIFEKLLLLDQFKKENKFEIQNNGIEDFKVQNPILASPNTQFPVTLDILTFASLDQPGLNTLQLPKRDLHNNQDLIIPIAYKKNEFYLGAGLVNNFSEFKVGTDFGKARETAFDITYFSMGYFRKIAPSWSLGAELNIAHIQNLSMSREISDYHQTSNSFEYISGIMTHGHSNFIGLPLMLKFQPLRSRFSLYGGVNIAYSYSTQTNFRNDFEGENTIIRDLRVYHTGSKYVKNADGGLVAGASIRIWKGFELEARAVIGLADISDDYYWGEQKNTTSHYRLGIKYRFLN